MALIGTDDDPTNPGNAANPSQPGQIAGGNVTGGAGGFIGGGSGQGATTKAAPTAAPTSSGGYTNLTQYLQANQSGGATNGQAGENVVQKSANDAMAAQRAYNTDATADITAKSAGLGVDPAEEARINAGVATVDPTRMAAITEGGNSTTGHYTGPTAPATAYGGPASGSDHVQYGGPAVGSFTGQTAADNSAAQGANQTVSGNANNAQGGQAGVSSLLKSAYGGSQTQGENSLDAFLANGTAGGSAALGQAAGVNQGVQGSYSKINDALTGMVGKATTAADATNAQYDADIKRASGDTTARDAYAKAIADATAKANAYQAPAPPPPPAPAPTPPGPTSPGNKGSGLSQVENAISDPFKKAAAAIGTLNPLNPGGAGNILQGGKPITGLNPQNTPTTSAYSNVVKAVSGGAPAVKKSVNTNIGNAKRAFGRR